MVFVLFILIYMVLHRLQDLRRGDALRCCLQISFKDCPAANCNGWLLVFKDLNTDQPCDLVCSNSLPNSDKGCEAKIFFSIYCSMLYWYVYMYAVGRHYHKKRYSLSSYQLY